MSRTYSAYTLWMKWRNVGWKPQFTVESDHFPVQFIVEIFEVREIIADVNPVEIKLELWLRFQITNDPRLLHCFENFIMPSFLF